MREIIIVALIPMFLFQNLSNGLLQSVLLSGSSSKRRRQHEESGIFRNVFLQPILNLLKFLPFCQSSVFIVSYTQKRDTVELPVVSSFGVLYNFLYTE